MAFVVSEGTVRGLSRPGLPTAPRLMIADGLSMDYLALWRSQGAVRTVVGFLGRNIAQLGLHVYRRKGDTDRERVTDHPLARLLSQPNLWTTGYRMMDSLVHDLAIFDRAYWWKVKTGTGLGLVRLPPPLVTPKGDNWVTPSAFEISGGGGRRVVKASELVYFRGYGGEYDFGASPLEALRTVLAEEYAASKYRADSLRNGARVSGYLERPVQGPEWSKQARENFRAAWRAQYTGDGPQVGGTPILEDGMTFKPASQTAKDLQYVETRKLTREEVAAAYYIPPPMVGILERATFSNITEQHKMLYQDTLGPWLRMITEELALQLIPEIPGSQDLYCEFNLREKLSGSFEERAAAMQASVGAPYMTVNEARALDNRPPLEGGDELIRPLNVTQNGDQEPVPAEPGAAEPDDDEEDKGADDEV